MLSDHASSPCLPFPPSLLLKKNKTAGTSHKKVFRMKTSACRDGTLKNQPNKMGTTPQLIHTIPTSCAILQTMHNKTSLHAHQMNTVLSTAHSTAFHIKDSPYRNLPHSAEIEFHLKLPTYHTDPALLTVSAYKTDYTCHAQ